MDAYISKEIQFDKFYITNSLVLAIYPEENQRIRLDKLNIKCDFEILNTEVKDNFLDFIVNFNVSCNEEEKPGYLVDIGAVGEFRLNNVSEIDEKTEKQYRLLGWNLLGH